MMCGIAGMIDFAGLHGDRYESLLETMRRRGPDDSGIYVTPDAVLLHTRLAVVDPEHGKQPMRICRGGHGYTMVYNGELYNVPELREALAAAGESFTGHSDTEVLLKAYLHWGEDCLERLNGIFAFAIWNETSGELFFARDRMGVKPFFYACPNGNFLFASEIKTLLAQGVSPIVDETGIAELLFIGPGRTPGCGVFRDIAELEPGCCGRLSKGGLTLRRYWQLTDREHTDDFDTTVETVRYLVTDAITRQLVSDVPLGTFLSGGLDSSLISAIAAKELQSHGEQLQTFSVTYQDQAQHFKQNRFQPDTDDAAIRTMTEFLGSKHRTYTLDTPELVQGLYSAVDARDLPGMADVDASLLLFCKKVKEQVTVTLSGECADEVFGGYPWFRNPAIREAYGFPWAQSTAYRQTFLRPRFAIDGATYVDRRYQESLAEVSKCPGLSPLERRMREMSHLNLKWFMQTLLDRKDRMSMYSGLEVRVPFCDHRIVEYLYSIPWDWKDYKHTEKGLLRTAMAGILPESVLWRKKNPYPKTHNPSYLQAVSAELSELLGHSEAPLWQLVDKKAAASLLTEPRAEPWYGQLMTTPQTIAYFLQLNYWLGTYHVELR